MDEPLQPEYIFLLQAADTGQKYIFYDVKEALEKGFLLQASVTRIRRYPDGHVSEMVIYLPSPSPSPIPP
jgi:hypothetical protein